MVLAITVNKRGVVGDLRYADCSLAWDSSYPTGGEPFTPADAGFDVWSAQVAAKTIVFKYDLIPNLSSMTVNVNSDNANGTTFFEQTLSVTLQKIDHDMTNELILMAYSRAQIFVQDQNDNVFLLGMVNGCHVTGGTVITGAAMGDQNGYTIEWAAQEKNALMQMKATDGPAETGYPFDGLSDVGDLTITVGT